MVVNEMNLKKIILPLLIGVICAFLYVYLDNKMFIAMIGGIALICMSLYNVNIGIGVALFTFPFVTKSQALLLLAFIAVIFAFDRMFINNHRIRKSHMDIPILLFIMMIIISTLLSTDINGSIRDLAIHIISICFMFTMINSIKNKQELNILITIFIMSAVLVSIYGLYQYKIGIKADSAWVDVANNPDLKTRVYSIFGNPNILAEYLIMALPFSVALFWSSKNMLKKATFLVTTLILTITLVLTFSRGGWLGFAFGLFIFIIIVEKRLLLAAIPVGILSIFLMPASIFHRLMTITNLSDSSNAYRIKVWSITLDIIRDNWLTGVGFGYLPFKSTFVKYIRTMNVYHSHNMYLETFSEMGILGILSLIFLIFIVFKYSIIAIKKSDAYISTLGAGALAAFASILFHGLFENVLYLPRIIITFWIVIGFILTIQKLANLEGNKGI
ncbi:O-antigen ligase family protein [Abyssisolibacter fermentans]|uniref:O-antigen ligase family protein n=1 Tax=Abyssisolibacter fermentans TaxID=1766203 RepID=UPI00082E5E50|nr:O-antigen ligase family protein [Abyssisolibacter fermentans]